jgi:hypothetical protein
MPTPVDYDPFADKPESSAPAGKPQSSAPAAAPKKGTPVDHDPFKKPSEWELTGYEALGAGQEVYETGKAIAKLPVKAMRGAASLTTREGRDKALQMFKNIDLSKLPIEIANKVVDDFTTAWSAANPLGEGVKTKEEALEAGRSAVRVGTDILGAEAVGKAALQGAGAVAGAVGGASSRASEASARALEKAGVKLEARQVKATKPESSAGFGTKNIDKNQSIANRVMGEDTGRVADKGQQLTREYINERKKALGDRYKKIYTKDKFFAFPQNVIDELSSFYQQEASLGPAGASIPKRTAGNILNEFQAAGGKPGSLQINGEGLQRLRTDLLEAARSSTSSADKNMAYKLVGLLDDTVEQNFPGLKKVMGQLNQQYRATIALDELESIGALKNGDVSGSRAGAFFRSHPSVGTKMQREFARHAENVKLQARWEAGSGAEAGVQPNMWQQMVKTLNVAPRTQAARLVQSRIRARMKGKTPATMTTADDAQNAADIEEFAKANAQPIDYTKGKKPAPSNQNPPPTPNPFDPAGGFF